MQAIPCNGTVCDAGVASKDPRTKPRSLVGLAGLVMRTPLLKKRGGGGEGGGGRTFASHPHSPGPPLCVDGLAPTILRKLLAVPYLR